MTLDAGQIQELIDGVYKGAISTKNLPLEYYYNVISELTEDDDEFFELDDEQKKKDKHLILWLILFAGAKTYQLISELQALTILSYALYIKAAEEVFAKYEDWLKAEKDSAQWARVEAARWARLKKSNTNLKYQTMGDELVCPICQPLNGIVAPASDSFWATYWPPNHFRCRCSVVATLDPPTNRDISAVGSIMNPAFKNNAGISGEVFPNHPYFDVPKKDKGLARKNFNLPLPNNEA